MAGPVVIKAAIASLICLTLTIALLTVFLVDRPPQRHRTGRTGHNKTGAENTENTESTEDTDDTDGTDGTDGTESTTSMDATCPVKFILYDLSQGILEVYRVGGVWHTSIQVCEKDYFFTPDGIRTCKPETVFFGNEQVGLPEVNSMLRDVNETKLCETTVSKEKFSEYLDELRDDKFKDSSYNMFDHNGNHFTDHVAKYLCNGVGIPSEFIDYLIKFREKLLPEKVIDGVKKLTADLTCPAMDDESGNVVELWIYDLAQGKFFTDPPNKTNITKDLIYGIWHTSIVVNETEYTYTSQGIHMCDRGTTLIKGEEKPRAPVRKQKLCDDTSKTDQQLFTHLKSLSWSNNEYFHGDRYDIYENNGNHFTNNVANYLCSKNIPEYLLEIPQKIKKNFQDFESTFKEVNLQLNQLTCKNNRIITDGEITKIEKIKPDSSTQSDSQSST